MNYLKPPLPFMGNKRFMLKNIKEAIREMQTSKQINKDTLILDVFGGSGLISHNLKQMLPQNEVIWNDYDNYQERLDNIKDTEKLRALLYEKFFTNHDEKITKEKREQILDLIKEFSKNHYVDYITISSYLFFSSRYAKDLKELEKNKTYYSKITATPLKSEGYLQGVKRVNKDFTELLKEYESVKNKLLILDPPYLQTEKGNYKDHFTLKQFMSLFKYLSKPYLFFGSETSEVIDFFECFKEYNTNLENYTTKKACLSKGGYDFIIYPEQINLFNLYVIN